MPAASAVADDRTATAAPMKETTMEWVEMTAKSLDQAKELALDELGVGADDAEFEVLEEPRTGLFGRVRGEARIRARVRPATVRPKQDRRSRRPADGANGSGASALGGDSSGGGARQDGGPGGPGRTRASRGRNQRSDRPAGRSNSADAPAGDRTASPSVARQSGAASNGAGRTGSAAQGASMDDDEQQQFHDDPERGVVAVDDVRVAAEQFANGLVSAFGLTGTTSATVDGSDIEVRIAAQGDGEGLGLLIGPGGRTLLAIQDLARVAAQRRLGDHESRLRIDVAGYREKRRIALERFAQNVAEVVKQSGSARSLEPMPSADRKVIHDALSVIDGVVSRSEGEDPHRRIIVGPA